ncbi:MAG: M14 metallopeptidase family protein [Flavobacteriaceae bacterium]
MQVNRQEYIKNKALSVQGRYVTLDHILPFLSSMTVHLNLEQVGISVLGLPIQSLTIGSGKLKILMWSQMHGNESTTTKAILDLLNYLSTDGLLARTILEKCQLRIIPILNPDGAKAYTRLNANSVDLNRDAQTLTQPESKALQTVYKLFKPDFCFNLHDQRTIFNVADTARPATVSFLAPTFDVDRTVSGNRLLAMRLIVAMNKALQLMIPGQVGRYDDSFNANCIGDTLQMMGIPTVLVEAGHFGEDYQREYTRELIFWSLLSALETLARDKLDDFVADDYFLIPENNKLFFDILIKNAHHASPKYRKGSNLGILFQEKLVGNTIEFISNIEVLGNGGIHYGHKTFDCADPMALKMLKSQSFWSEIVI